MRVSIWICAAIAALSLTACDHGGGGSDNGGNAGANTTPLDSYYIVADAAGNAVSLYKNGVIQTRLGSGSSSPVSVIVHPNKKFVYVGHGFIPAISTFKADRAAAGGFDYVATASSPIAVSTGIVTPNGKFLYGLANNQRYLVGYSIDAATGALSAIVSSPIDIGATTQLTSVAVTLDSAYLVVSDTYGQRLLSYAIDPATGALTFKNSRGVGGAVGGLRTNPVNGRIYFAVGVGVLSDTTVAADGTLSANGVSGLTFPNAALIRFSADGKLLFAGGISGEVNSYQLDSALDKLTLAASVSGLGMPISALDYDSSSGILGVVSPAANQGLSTYEVTSSGQMSLLQFYPSPATEQATGLALISF